MRETISSTKPMVSVLALLTLTGVAPAHEEGCTVQDCSDYREYVYGKAKMVDDLSRQVAELRRQLGKSNRIEVPKGAVIAFNRNSCPEPGWRKFSLSSGRAIIGSGKGQNLTNRGLLETGGEETVTLTSEMIPGHSHPLKVFFTERVGAPGATIGQHRLIGENSWRYTDNDAQKKTVETGGSNSQATPFNNMPPYIVLTYCERI